MDLDASPLASVLPDGVRYAAAIAVRPATSSSPVPNHTLDLAESLRAPGTSSPYRDAATTLLPPSKQHVLSIIGQQPSPSEVPGGNSESRSTKLFYGGDWDLQSGLFNEYRRSGPESRVYDDVRWGGGWKVTELYSINVMYSPDAPENLANWEVRKDVSRGNGGTVVAAGDLVPATTNKLGSCFGFPLVCLWEVKVTVPAFTLPGGHYWINVQPFVTGAGRSYQGTTEGANSVGSPIANGQAYWNSPEAGYNFVPAGSVLGDYRTWDFSGGLNGP
jgi:hypothetical protein